MGVEFFEVADDGEGRGFAGAVEDVLEGGEVEPEVVGVEVAMALDVLEVVEFVLGALGDFAEEEGAADGFGEVSAFAVGGGAAGDFHDEGKVLVGEMAEEGEVEDGAEVVGIGDEGVAEAAVEELVEEAGGGEGDIKIAVAGGAPGFGGLAGPLSGDEGVGAEAGDAVLEEAGGDAVLTPGKFGVSVEDGGGVIGGGEAVHEQQGEGGVVFAAEVEDLAADEVEEGEAVFDGEEGLGAVESHAGAEATVEFDEEGVGKGAASGGFGGVEVGEGGDVVEGFEGGDGDGGGLAVADALDLAAEGPDEEVGSAVALEHGANGLE